jgi:hypothetical protein
MSRKLIKVLVPVAALVCLVVGSTVSRSNNAGVAGDQAVVATVDFEQTFADTMAMPRGEYTPAILTAMNFYQIYTETSARSRGENRPAITKINFDQTFADTTARPHPANTPPNREKLRDAGWVRIIGSR